MDNLLNMRERIGAALSALTAWNNDYFGIGGAAGDLDREQFEALLQVAWTLENIIEQHEIGTF